MIYYTIQVSLVSACMYLGYYLFFRHLTFHTINRWYLLSTICLSFALPFAQHLFEAEPIMVSAMTLAPVELTTAAFTPILATSKLPVWSTLYWIGVVLMAVRLAISLTVISRRIYGSKLRMIDGHKVYINPNLETTFTFLGRIYSGTNTLQYDVKTILQHEEVHIQQLHTFDLILVEISHVLLWFNPILIWIKKSIQLTHEYQADDIMCKSVSKYTYCTLLLQASNPYYGLILTNSFFNSQIKKRIQMMTQKHSSWYSLLRYAVVIPILGSLIFIFSCKGLVDETLDESSPIEKAQSATEKYKAENSDGLEKVDIMPLFPNSTDEASSHKEQFGFIFENLVYPEEAKQAGVEGTVVVEFVVTKEGTLDNIKMLKDIGFGCGDAVLEMMGKMTAISTRWTPGKYSDGTPVNTLLKLPVRFKLEQ